MAVKKLHDHVAEREGLVTTLAEEARLTSQLNHHHIAQVHEFHMERDEGFLIYEFVPGITVADLLRRQDGGRSHLAVPVCKWPLVLRRPAQSLSVSPEP